ncbi:MAG: sulfite exporter TauE/SafE family protein, partial [Erythrobacter sp.]|nr:sulfite exporter TauE/SafE family protein [Erythrobacter sp.]
MDVYLPIANLSVNGLVLVALGGLTGILSGLFGVGGGFLTTPLLIFYGIPPTVAAASAATQVTGASVSGVFAHSRRKGVDYRMGLIMVAGGIVGALVGAGLFRLLQSAGQIDVVINILYVVLLGTIGSLMMREALDALFPNENAGDQRPRKRRHHPLVAGLPFRTRFYRSGLYISPLAPLILGMLVGILTMLMGVGGGFILVPAMLYILGMSGNVVVGTSLFQILFVTMVTTMTHALTTKAVDIVLAGLLLLGSVMGAQFGTQIAMKARPEVLRLVLAAIVIAVALR